MNYTIVFFSHAGALKFERKLQSQNIPCELSPIPRKLSASCGVGAKVIYDGDILDLMDNNVEKIFQESDNKYALVYDNS